MQNLRRTNNQIYKKVSNSGPRSKDDPFLKYINKFDISNDIPREEFGTAALFDYTTTRATTCTNPTAVFKGPTLRYCYRETDPFVLKLDLWIEQTSNRFIILLCPVSICRKDRMCAIAQKDHRCRELSFLSNHFQMYRSCGSEPRAIPNTIKDIKTELGSFNPHPCPGCPGQGPPWSPPGGRRKSPSPSAPPCRLILCSHRRSPRASSRPSAASASANS